MKVRIKKLIQRLKTDKKLAGLFFLYVATVVVVSYLFIQWPEYANKTTYILFLISLMLVTLFTWSMAALAIFRSLLVVGAGLSLVLFIAQSYCALPLNEQVADDSLQSLIGISVLFIGVMFFNRLYRELFGNPESKREFDKLGALKVFREANKGKDSVLILVLYASFMGLILGQLFQVLFPIFINLCVYQP
ncbi:hypothetical protein H6786_00445 [Candidatus Nomurabacteria bacterium]|nr:hypothetical protein [Candidatus Nomurabacteria bacterium]